MRVRVWPVAVAVLAASCSLPSRDNPDDPAYRPSADLKLSSGRFAAGCLSPDHVGGDLARGDCLFADTSASFDPQGISDIVSREVTLQTTSGTVVAAAALDSSGQGVFDGNETLALSPVHYRAVLVVKDSTNRSSSVALDVLVSNQPPTPFASAVRHVPIGAAWWSTSGAPAIRFGSTDTIDPEGDPLTHSWTLVRSNVPGIGPATSNAAALDVALPAAALGTSAAPGFAVWRYVAADASSTSAPAEVELELGDPLRWLVGKTGATATLAERHREGWFASERILGTPSFTFGGPGTLPDAVYFCHCTNGCTFVEESPVSAGLDCPGNGSGSIAGYMTETRPVALASDPARNRVWLAMHAFDPSDDDGAVLLDPAALSQPPPTTLDLSAFPADGYQFSALDDDSGDLWVGHDGADHVLELHGVLATITTAAYFAPAGQVVGALALRPSEGGGNDAWIALRKDSLSAGTPGIGLLVVDPSGVEAPGSFVLPPSLADAQFVEGLRFLAPDLAFAHLLGKGFAFFDVDATSRTLSLAKLVPSDEGPALDYVVDASTLSVRALESGRQAVVTVPLAGPPVRSAGADTIAALSPADADGAIFTLVVRALAAGSEARLLRGAGVGPDGVAASVAIGSSTARPVQDRLSGDLWAPSDLPPGATRFSQEGARVDSFDAFSTGAITISPRPPVAISVDPQDGSLWYVERGDGNVPDRVWLLDPSASRAAPGAIATAAGPWPVELSAGAAADAHAVPGGALVVSVDTTPAHRAFLTVARDGTISAAADAPGASDCDPTTNPLLPCEKAAFVVDEAGGVCVAGNDGSAVTLDRFDRALSLLWTHSSGGMLMSYPDPVTLLDLASAAGECWAAVHEATFNGSHPNVVLRADATSLAASSYRDPNDPSAVLGANAPALLSIEPVEPRGAPSQPSEFAWAGGANGDFVKVRFDGTQTLVLDTSDTLSVGAASVFVRH